VFSLAVRSAVPKRSPDSDPGRAVRHQGAVSPSEGTVPAGPASADPSSPDRRAHRRHSSKPAANAGRLGYPEPLPPSLGFPAPPPPPANAVAEPPAVGGVRYQPFPDPRTADGPELRRPAYIDPSALPGPAAAASEPSQPSADPSPPASGPSPTASGPSPAASGPSSAAMPAPASGSPEAEQPDDDRPAPRSEGKHTVPDELVRAATYRLPPDRVFRAKVPNGSNLPEEPTTNLSVPKPRRP
ncbi:MAG: hypothetical protein SYR96_31585, partial [Actinomycetota bacterium]|nr:hypothetical protein [Actinomycetota bacterium]